MNVIFEKNSFHTYSHTAVVERKRKSLIVCADECFQDVNEIARVLIEMYFLPANKRSLYSVFFIFT